MKFLDYTDLLGSDAAVLACLTTFNFDPDFFERRLLRTPALEQARRILIFMDGGQWRQLLAQDTPARWLNRRYLVVPVQQDTGVFHAKINLLIAKDGLSLHCGSANLTRAGCSHNLEMLNAIRFSFATDNPNPDALSLMQSAFRFFERAVGHGHEEAARIAGEWLQEVRDGQQWVSQEAEGQGRVSLIHSYDGPLWERVERTLSKAGPTRILIISPFFDPNARMFRRIRSRWPECRIEIIAQEGTTNLPVAALKALRSPITLNAIGTASRRLHAKLIVFQEGREATALVGSANFTAAALEGRNTEACLLVRDAGDLVERLFDSQLATKCIRLDEFEPGDEEEPQRTDEVQDQLRITEALLLAGDKLRVTYSHRLAQQPKNLAVALRVAGEPRPRASMLVPNRQAGATTVNIPKASMAEAHGSLLVSLVAETESDRRESLPIWAIQEPRLTYEPSEGQSSDKKRIVEETGHGLPEYLDELGKANGTAGVIEYLTHLNIRFYDGSGGPRGRFAFRLQRHDPFHADTRPEWMLPGQRQDLDLREAIYEFCERHEGHRLRRHAERGNINGVENFLDIFTTMVRLLYVFFRRGVVEKMQFIGRVCRYVEIASGGFEEEEDGCPGYLQSLAENLEGDKSLLRKVCHEANFGGFVRAAFYVVQRVRCDSDGPVSQRPKVNRPSESMPIVFKKLQSSFDMAGIPMPSDGEVVKALAQFRMVSDEEYGEWVQELSWRKGQPSSPAIPESGEEAILGHFRMQELLKVAQFALRQSRPDSAQCTSWVRKQLEEVGVGWKEWLCMLDQYGRDFDAKSRVDHFTAVICGGV